LVDKVYKGDIPQLRKTLERLREDFSALHSQTNWMALRIEPLLNHVQVLEQLVESPEFSEEFSRLRRGVSMFHSDLVYFRTNISELKKILEAERKSSKRKNQKL